MVERASPPVEGDLLEALATEGLERFEPRLAAECLVERTRQLVLGECPDDEPAQTPAAQPAAGRVEQSAAEAGAVTFGLHVKLVDFAHRRIRPQPAAAEGGTGRTERGFARLEWQKLRERNEALDCRTYARAAAWIAGADRWPEAKWRDLEAQVGAVAGDHHTDIPPTGDVAEPDPEASAGRVRPRRSAHGRRVFTPSYLR